MGAVEVVIKAVPRLRNSHGLEEVNARVRGRR